MSQQSASNIVADDFYLRFENEFLLTGRELEIVQNLTLHGYNNRDLAASLKISEKTIKNHVGNILKKTSTKSSRQLQALVFCRMFSETDPKGYEPNHI
ncbi:helix-turn-helix transcriptional regulator (plasmid) [Paenibacillus sonchi]|uniref:Helix-turn-helix transcriptional regulator n=1 Tax=Paenibacillus sonchi TaxID=373687 RepID=A0A974PJ39_9BACL|nr:helix-turn-helix transcriptional regulator [Paenibacillus sonchi]QQZ64523.1 helix-turn-helix transcriptional regulator [Paenibacillus sonchi]